VSIMNIMLVSVTELCTLADKHLAGVDRDGIRLRRCSRRLFRLLSGASGGRAQSDRGAAVRVGSDFLDHQQQGHRAHGQQRSAFAENHVTPRMTC
jgi:hypothetical protein